MKKIIEKISIITIATSFLLGLVVVGNMEKSNKTVSTSTTIDETNIESLDNKKIGWGIKRNDNHEQPDVGSVNRKILVIL